LHDLLLALGDLTAKEIRERSASPRSVRAWIEELENDRRVFRFKVGRQERFAAIEDASRYRDSLDVELPVGLPAALLESVDDPLGDLFRRSARIREPFTGDEPRKRFAVPTAQARLVLEQLEQSGSVVSGAFLPGGSTKEWCDVEVLRRLKRASLARLRAEVEPVEPAALARLYAEWQWVRSPRRGMDGLRAVIEQLQGCPLVVSTLEGSVLLARLQDYEPAHLDELCSSGEVVWRGVDSLGSRDGRLALYLRDQYER
jgi:ATP-dependent Lhr-like helicase